MKESKLKRYLWLFRTNLFISAFTFGGGYVVVPMIRKYFVFQKKLFTEEELLNMAAIAQSTPGAIAINLSALAGHRVAGIPGTIISCIATVIPPLIILSIVSVWYTAFASNGIIAAILRGMQAGVAALIVDLIVDMCQAVIKERSLLLNAMMPCAFIASFLLEINVALVLIVCCLLCIVRVWYRERSKK